jgi:hypothetical protein
MSHFTRVRTTLRDPVLLAAALRASGYATVEVHDSPQKLHGWLNQTAQAEIIVRRKHARGHVFGDFGFTRTASGVYEVVIDSSDRVRNGADWLPRLTQAYGHAAAMKYAEDHGYEVVTDESEKDGTRRLTLRRYVLNGSSAARPPAVALPPGRPRWHFCAAFRAPSLSHHPRRDMPYLLDA